MPLKGAGNISFVLDSVDFTPYMDTQKVAATVNQIETTHFNSTGTEAIAGLPTWSFSAGGKFDAAVDAVLGPMMITPPTDSTMVDASVGVATVSYDWTAKAFTNNYVIDASNPTAGITWSADITLSGVPVRT